MIGVRIRHGRGAKIEGVEVWVSGSSKEKLLVTGTEEVMIKVGAETRDGNEERVSGRDNCAR